MLFGLIGIGIGFGFGCYVSSFSATQNQQPPPLRPSADMALRLPAAVIRPLRPLGLAKPSAQQARWLATPVHPVTQTSSPTAMVFLNMGGPGTVDEVGDFLSRLFVSAP